ncbi:MAG: hypothetical protein GXY74_09925 [Phycisphaerae bacterium]|nr:hypothetical protein [Phycisphaerae bacterium]
MGKRKTIVAVTLAALAGLVIGAGGGLAVSLVLRRGDAEAHRKELALLTNRCDTLMQQVQGLEAAVKTRDEKCRQAAADLAKARDEAKDKYDELAAQHADLKVQLGQRQTELQRAQDDLTRQRQAHADAQARMRDTIEKLSKELQELKAGAGQ